MTGTHAAEPRSHSTPADDLPGYFGPHSVSWRVLTAPPVALMIAQITNFLENPHEDFQSVLIDHDPLFPTNNRRQRGRRGRPGRKSGTFHDRLRRTVAVPLPIVLGDARTADRVADRLRAYHEPMRGTGPDGVTPYAATSAGAMLFASVTISHAALIAYEHFAAEPGESPARLPDEDRDRYFAEMARMAVLMGVPEQEVPTSSDEVARYYRSVAPRLRFRPGWWGALGRTAAALVVPAGRDDLAATAGDILLLASGVVAFAVLPAPCRRLYGMPAAAEPVFAAVRVAAAPLAAVVRHDRVYPALLTLYLGEEDARMVQRARRAACAMI